MCQAATNIAATRKVKDLTAADMDAAVRTIAGRAMNANATAPAHAEPLRSGSTWAGDRKGFT